MNDLHIHTIDLNFLGQKSGIAAFAIEHQGKLILIESGPHSTLPTLQKAIEYLGYTDKDVTAVFLTHIHLDHAGAAWHFAKNGTHVYVHPFGYPHILDPSRLLASAKLIYKEAMDMLWGTLEPIAETQLHAVNDQEEVDILGLRFKAHHTPGHAKHHIAWEVDNNLFTGDVAGVCINHGPVIPPCPPPDIDIEEWSTSIAAIQALPHIDHFYLTHFGKIDAHSDHLDRLQSSLNEYAGFVEPFAQRQASIEECLPTFTDFVQTYLMNHGLRKDDALAYEAANPSNMSLTGLMRYWTKKNKIS